MTQDQAQDRKIGNTQEPTPLTREELKFVAAYRQYRYGGDGIYKAAEKARIPKNRAVRTFNKPEVQEEIDRQDEAVRQERAKQEVKADELTVAFANRELMKTVQQLGDKGDAAQRLEALRLVYVVTGRIQAGTTRVLETAPSGDEGEGAPERFDYRALIKVEQAAPVPIVPAAPEQGSGVRDQGSVEAPAHRDRTTMNGAQLESEKPKITPSVNSKVPVPKTGAPSSGRQVPLRVG